MNWFDKRPIAAMHNIAATTEARTDGEPEDNPRRRFLARLTQLGAGVIGGGSLLRAASASADAIPVEAAAPATAVAELPTADVIAADVARLRAEMAKPNSTVAIYCYGPGACRPGMMDASGAWVPCPVYSHGGVEADTLPAQGPIPLPSSGTWGIDASGKLVCHRDK